MANMKRHLDNWIDDLAKKSWYSWDFLMDRFNEMMDENEVDIYQFVGITMEHDW